MIRRKILPIILMLALLCGCSAAQEENETTETPEIEATTEATEPSTEPPTEETEPAYDDGPVVYVNGTRIEDTFRDSEVIYVSATEFCLAMEGTVEDDGSASLEHNGTTLTFSPNYGHMMLGEKAIVLLSPVLNYQGKAYLPMDELRQMLELSLYWDTEYDCAYCTAAAWPRDIPEGYDVPVLMYHAVSNNMWGIENLFVKPELLEEQLKYLTENGYDPIFFEDLYHVDQYDKPVILTFDDGYMDNYTELFPLLKKYNAKATIFIITGSMNTNLYLTSDQIIEMADSGLVSIQSHTYSHPDLDELSLEDQKEELEKSKLQTTRLSRREPYVLCYPTGKYNSDTLSIIGDSYNFGLKMNGNLYNTSDSQFEINRYYISRATTTAAFKSILEQIF